MAHSSVCTDRYAQKALDGADIVRDAMLRQAGNRGRVHLPIGDAWRLRFSVEITYSIIRSMRENDSEQEHRREGNDARLRELVTVRSFCNPSEAMIVKAMLDSAGIECFLADDNAARILGSDISGIRVQVNRVDADAAIALLEQPIPEDNDLDSC